MKNKKTKAFTLIELLVVIAIIGLLAGAISVSFSAARKKSRDSRRLSDMKAIEAALAMFYDTYGHYPYSGGCGVTIPNASWCNSGQNIKDGQWIKDSGNTTRLKEFLSKNPVDPKYKNVNWGRKEGYFYYSAGYKGLSNTVGYLIVLRLESFGTDFEKQNHGAKWPDGANMGYDGNNNDGIIIVGKGILH